jgi:hypothetical protein
MVPDRFKGKANDIAVIGYSLADLGLRLSLNTLPMAYVIHGTPGYMAQLQSGIAGLHGFDVHPKAGACDEKSATVVLTTPKGETHEVSFTMAEAERAGLTKDKPGRDGKPSTPSMYKLWPGNMLVARATTRAISWYCPEVKLGLAGTIDMAEVEAVDAVSHEVDPEETGEIVTAASAKNQLVKAYEANIGLTHGQAITCAKLLWDSHRLGRDPIPLTRLTILLDAVASFARDMTGFDAAPEPETATVPPCEADTDEELAEGEIVEEQPGMFGKDGDPF